MKLLTLLSAVFLPAVVLAGVMGMNFELPFFENAGQLLGRRRGDGRVRGWASAWPAGDAGCKRPSDATIRRVRSARTRTPRRPRPRRCPDPAAHRRDQPGADEQPDAGAAGRLRRSPATGRRGRRGGRSPRAGSPARHRGRGRAPRRRRLSAATVTVDPAPPYLAALDSRLRTTCSTYVGSAVTVGRPDATSSTKVTPGQRPCF